MQVTDLPQVFTPYIGILRNIGEISINFSLDSLLKTFSLNSRYMPLYGLK